jgi:hypothetical protein
MWVFVRRFNLTDLVWRKLKTVKTPDPSGVVWTPALDYLVPKRMYRLQTKNTSQWTLDGANAACNADGYDAGPPRNGNPLCSGSPFGALIAKIGGGTADSAGTIFAVGRYCVFQIVDDSKNGPLYLGANDIPGGMSKITGQIEVEVEIAL